MGIVVSLAMLLGLLILLPLGCVFKKPKFAIFAGRFLLLAGLWNALWFGLRHLTEFWGVAALISGVAMILAAIQILIEYQDSLLSTGSVGHFLNKINKTITLIKPVIILVLLLSFLLYATTIVRLNLGLPIVG